MIEVARAIADVRDCNGSNQKTAFLKHYASVPHFKDVLKFIYNPYVKTGISTAKLKDIRAMAARISEPVEISITAMIKFLSENTTGSDAVLAQAAHFLAGTCNESAWLAEAIITQELKIGVTATTLNKAYGAAFIPVIGCMLGTKYNDIKVMKWPAIVTNKEDGIRRILVKKDGAVKLYSRSGHEDFGLVEILMDAHELPDNTVYDGELVAKGTFKDCIAQRQASSSLANSKGTKTGLEFRVFDMIPVEDFEAGYCKIGALARKATLAAVLHDESLEILADLIGCSAADMIASFGTARKLEHIKPVPILAVAHSFDDVLPIVEAIWNTGWEGVMLNTINGPYEVKRSKELVKVKRVEEYRLKIVGFQEGTGKFEGMLGALLVDYKGTEVGVGSGFNDEQRMDIWSKQSQYLGKYVEIDSFGESTNAAGGTSLNCPIFKRVVGHE